jgi:hypothetical protein
MVKERKINKSGVVCMPICLVIGMLRQEDYKFEASVDYTARHYLQKNNERKKPRNNDTLKKNPVLQSGYNKWKWVKFSDQKQRSRLALVAHTCNPSYLGGRDQEDHGSRSALRNSSRDPILKISNTKTGLVQWLKW